MLETGWVALGFLIFLVVFLGGWETRWRWYLFPFLPWLSRSWFLLEPAKEMRFFSAAFEGLRGFHGRATFFSGHPTVLLFSLSCFMPALGATNLIDFLNAMMFAIGMVLALGYMRYFERDIARGIPVADQLLVMFTALAWVYKLVYGYQLGLSPLLVRGGGVYASNQYISIAICLLPFVRNRWIVLASIATILLQFSRGGFVAIGLIIVLSLFVRKRSDTQSALVDLVQLRTIVFICLGGAMIVVLMSIFAQDGFKFLIIRLVGGGAFGLNLEIADSLASLPLTDLITLATESARGDDRNLIWATALKISEANNLVGVGVGNFVVAASTLNAELLYSNAHNLYLTLLSELGLASCLMFIIALLIYVWTAYRHSVDGFIALVTFAVYGIFSGQIYETSSEVSITQFIVLLFVFTNVDYKKLQNI